jgi:hypothetical protein
MTDFLGLKFIDLAAIVGYFALVIAIGFSASTKVHTDEDFFLGGRRFGKGLLVMHWLCTGTHSDMAVQVAGASARVGLGGRSLDYARVAAFASPIWRRFGFEIPRFTQTDWLGLLVAWAMVGGLIELLVWLAGLGRPTVV